MKIIILTLTLFIYSASYAQQVDKKELEAAGGELELYSNMQSTANVLYGIGIGLTTISFVATDNNGVPNVTLAVGGSVATFVGWVIDRSAHKHIKKAGYHLMSADSGIGVKLVF